MNTLSTPIIAQEPPFFSTSFSSPKENSNIKSKLIEQEISELTQKTDLFRHQKLSHIRYETGKKVNNKDVKALEQTLNGLKAKREPSFFPDCNVCLKKFLEVIGDEEIGTFHGHKDSNWCHVVCTNCDQKMQGIFTACVECRTNEDGWREKFSINRQGQILGKEKDPLPPKISRLTTLEEELIQRMRDEPVFFQRIREEILRNVCGQIMLEGPQEIIAKAKKTSDNQTRIDTAALLVIATIYAKTELIPTDILCAMTILHLTTFASRFFSIKQLEKDIASNCPSYTPIFVSLAITGSGLGGSVAYLGFFNTLKALALFSAITVPLYMALQKTQQNGT